MVIHSAVGAYNYIYDIYSEDTTGYRITTSADAEMMFVGSYRKVRASVSSDTYPRFIRYEHPRRPILIDKYGLGMAIYSHCVCHPIKKLG